MASDLGLPGPQGQTPEYRHTHTYNPQETDRDPSPQHTGCEVLAYSSFKQEQGRTISKIFLAHGRVLSLRCNPSVCRVPLCHLDSMAARVRQQTWNLWASVTLLFSVLSQTHPRQSSIRYMVPQFPETFQVMTMLPRSSCLQRCKTDRRESIRMSCLNLNHTT